MIESNIRQLITSNTQFTGLAGTRLYPVLLPTESPLPAVTYQSISLKTLYALDERVNFDQLRLQIDVWASTYLDSKALASCIVGILDNFSGSFPDGTYVDGIQLRNSTDYYEHEALTYRVMLQFDIQFSAAISQ
jgi:hypothetical protein